MDAGSTNSLYGGVRVSTRVMPALRAARGGDWCEAFVLAGGIVALSIGDVCGHGAEASGTMAAIRQEVRELTRRGYDPAQTLAEANRTVCARDADLHVTAIVALLDPHLQTLTFANAGHPPPLAIDASCARFLSFGSGDLPLGIQRAHLPMLRVEKVPAQTLLVLYTDGVTEHERQPLLGEAQLREAALRAYRDFPPPTAAAIERLMLLTEDNPDDASILAAWTPRAVGRNVARTSRLRHRRLTAYMAEAGRRPQTLSHERST